MKVSLDKAMEALSEFMAEQVHTINDPLKHSVGMFVVGALSKNPEGMMAKVRPWLEMSGILSDDAVDVDVFKAGLDSMFASTPKVSYLGFGITADEASGLVDRMRSKAQPAPATTTVTEVAA